MPVNYETALKPGSNIRPYYRRCLLAIRIITDSTSDIPLENQQSLGIDIVSLSVIIDGKKYTDGVDLKKEQFYDLLAKSTTLPTTSQVNPDGFLGLFQQYADAGDDIIVILISSKLSGTYQSAVIAKDMAGLEHVVDSKSATFGLALLVYEAIRMRDSGSSAEEIYTRLLELRNSIVFYAGVDTLKYLKMGGRLSSSAAVIGGMLHIKPLVSIVDGEVKAAGKVRGQKAVLTHLADILKNNPPDTRYPLVFGHTQAPALLEELLSLVSSVPMGPTYICEIGCVIATHSGPGCIGFAYIPR
jgi:DegV family protein with EDD domain